MAKSNDKKNRTKGFIESGNVKFPNPMTSCNNPMNTYDYTDQDRIKQQTMQNKNF